ncbi:DUF1453 domain-containing protein [Kitasatospora sp. NPDC048365]|uniref:DUF1453 domain-containing protein n=1 Tax=Kitasatospora sp. NPDC048365 TaxID=3364050 RepID=UPI00371C8087
MTTLANVLIALVVVVLVVGRQLKARPLETGRRPWLVPAVLAVIALRDPALIDHDHRVTAVLLLAGSLLTTLAMGCVWGWTVRLWRDDSGTLWTKGTRATAYAWLGMIAVRIGWYGAAAALHVRQGSAVLLLSLGGMLLVRGLVVNWRARGVEHGHTLAA